MPSIADLIAAERQAIHDAQVRLKALEDAQRALPAISSAGPGYGSLGAADAIQAFLRANGGSAKRSEILDALTGNYRSESADPRRGLQNALGGMKRRGVVKITKGRVKLV